jgi:hypothetical protein
VLAVSAQLFDMACLQLLGASLSATSLLIIVGTVMQSSRQVREPEGAMSCDLRSLVDLTCVCVLLLYSSACSWLGVVHDLIMQNLCMSAACLWVDECSRLLGRRV